MGEPKVASCTLILKFLKKERNNVKYTDVHKLYCWKPELINAKLRTLNPIVRDKIHLVGSLSNTGVNDLAYIITNAVGLQEQLTENKNIANKAL
jgi:hypothetical protein